MKASELRIGNWVNYVGHRNSRFIKIGEFELEPHHFGYLFEIEDDWDLLEPIPLTEEWLLKFGFKELRRITHEFEEVFYGKSIIKNKPNHYEQLVISLPTNNVEVGEFNIDESYLLNIFVTHVHQLQNLYFALTGEELTIKEE